MIEELNKLIGQVRSILPISSWLVATAILFWLATVSFLFYSFWRKSTVKPDAKKPNKKGRVARSNWQYRWLDWIFCRSIDDRRVDLGIKEYENYAGNELINALDAEKASIDAKASSLLGHLSTMIAVLTILYAVSETELVKRVMLIKTCLYLINLFLLLRVTKYLDSDTIQPANPSRTIMREVLKRMKYLNLSHSMATILNLSLIHI